MGCFKFEVLGCMGARLSKASVPRAMVCTAHCAVGCCDVSGSVGVPQGVLGFAGPFADSAFGCMMPVACSGTVVSDIATDRELYKGKDVTVKGFATIDNVVLINVEVGGRLRQGPAPERAACASLPTPAYCILHHVNLLLCPHLTSHFPHFP